MLVSILPTLIAGCGGNIAATVEPFCEAMKPVCPMRADVLSPPTATAILRNNEGGKALCGGKWARCEKVAPEPAKPQPGKPVADAPEWPWHVAPAAEPRKPEIDASRAKRVAVAE